MTYPTLSKYFASHALPLNLTLSIELQGCLFWPSLQLGQILRIVLTCLHSLLLLACKSAAISICFSVMVSVDRNCRFLFPQLTFQIRTGWGYTTVYDRLRTPVVSGFSPSASSSEHIWKWIKFERSGQLASLSLGVSGHPSWKAHSLDIMENIRIRWEKMSLARKAESSAVCLA